MRNYFNDVSSSTVYNNNSNNNIVTAKQYSLAAFGLHLYTRHARTYAIWFWNDIMFIEIRRIDGKIYKIFFVILPCNVALYIIILFIENSSKSRKQEREQEGFFTGKRILYIRVYCSRSLRKTHYDGGRKNKSRDIDVVWKQKRKPYYYVSNNAIS